MTTTTLELTVGIEELAWFDDSPDAGTPECICSYCGRNIQGCYLRIYREDENGSKEARICEECIQVVIKKQKVR